MLEAESCCLVVVDVQGKLAQSMHGREQLYKNIQILIQAARILQIPFIWCQQCPESLGPTVPEIAELLPDEQPVNKAGFSCWGSEQFRTRLRALGRPAVLLCGIETHICIYQTALQLAAGGYDVTVVADAVSSRTPENKQMGLKQIERNGAELRSVEMLLFELLKTARHAQFKQIATLIK